MNMNEWIYNPTITGKPHLVDHLSPSRRFSNQLITCVEGNRLQVHLDPTENLEILHLYPNLEVS